MDDLRVLDLDAIKSVKTPSQEARVLEYQLKKDAKKDENIWKSCLGCTSDRRLITYSTKLGVVVALMMFCSIQLVRLDKCDSDVYLALLSSLVGLIIPFHNHNNKQEED